MRFLPCDTIAVMNYDELLQAYKKEMEDAEDELANFGFPADQWMLIKQYIGAAILHNQIVVAKTMHEGLDAQSERPAQ